MVDVLIALQTWQAQNTPLTKLVTGLLLTRSVISVTPHDTGVESVSVVDTIQYQRILYNQLLSTVLSLNFEEKKDCRASEITWCIHLGDRRCDRSGGHRPVVRRA